MASLGECFVLVIVYQLVIDPVVHNTPNSLLTHVRFQVLAVASMMLSVLGYRAV
jgi:hypothetical protein